MTTSTIPHPPIVERDQWITDRQALLAEEKELTKHYDRIAAKRRRLPMVRIDKTYLFDSPQGTVTLTDLFEGRHQLIVYHFMFDPAWENGCPGCTGFINAMGDLSPLAPRDATFALISRAPLEKLERYKAQHGWSTPWYSSYHSDFNRDFQVTSDTGEGQGLSVFFRLDDDVFHTYSTYARGTEGLTDAFYMLDITPYGRQQDFEDSPPGWPQRPTYE